MFVFSLFSDCNSFCIVSLVLYGECSAGILFFLTLEIKRKKSSDDDSFVSRKKRRRRAGRWREDEGKKKEGQRRKRGSTNENQEEQEKVSSQEKWPLKWHLYSTRFSDSWLPLSFFQEEKVLSVKRIRRRRGRRCENEKRRRRLEEAGETTKIFLPCSDFNTWIVLKDFVVVKIKIFKTYFSVNNDNNEEKMEERTLSVFLSRLFSWMMFVLLFPEKRDTLTDENALNLCDWRKSKKKNLGLANSQKETFVPEKIYFFPPEIIFRVMNK